MARPPPESRTSRRSSLRIRTRLRFTNRIRRPIPRWAPRGAQDIVSPLLLSSASKPSLSPSQQQQQGTETEDERERERERPPRVLVTSAPNRVSMRAINMRIIMSSSTTTACDGQQALDLLLGTLSSQSQAQAGTSSRAASPISPTSPESPDKSATALESQSEPQYFDLISLDNATPVMTGQQAVRKLRSLGRTDFVVGATGNALKSGQKAYLEAGADQVLPKPVMLN
ncbi:hypothetical protein BOTBODRAFT_180571 [Botryobasidium botryosum FD-172 SS1]|uniref:Response regulatory domain-containing protein n=1 Tax=Botryobasidium botryosum (strain FD-172 SS1) TaxID=930990 RepID=A0A067LW43_BOTB1|nr:hypothetical protein BOTBODRAFT_180571 [Botryobasidium botryosum FD-172 SS1]